MESVPQCDLLKATHLQIGLLRFKKLSGFIELMQSPRAKPRLIFDCANVLVFFKFSPTTFRIQL